MIKAIVTALLLTGLLAANALAQTGNIPNLVGSWSAGPSHLHHSKQGFISIEPTSAKLTVTDQKGRVFHGTVEWFGKAPGKDTFSGVIDKDNVTFYMAGHTDAVRIGKMEGPDAFTFYFLNAGGPNPRAGYVEYKRVKK
ncbi:MAG: hypothetical protein ACLGSA_04695 [Acidobacteriota bacterium]